MAPTERICKRPKPSPSTDPQSAASLAASQPSTSPTSTSSPPPQDASVNRSSWYSRTWPRKAKAAPITQVARESISSASNSAVETASVIKDKATSMPSTQTRKSSLALTLGKNTPSKALPVGATTTTDHAMPERKNTQEDPAAVPLPADDSTPGREPADPPSKQTDTKKVDPAKDVTGEGGTSKTVETVQLSTGPQSWIGWLAGSDTGQTKAPSTTQSQEGYQESVSTGPLPEQTAQASTVASIQDGRDQYTLDKPAIQPEEHPPPTSASQRRSWLPIWNNVLASQSAPTVASPTELTQTMANGSAVSGDLDPKNQRPEEFRPQMDDSTNPSISVAQPQPANRSSAWVFWSRDKPAETQSLKDAPREGEVAVANTASESRPRRASIELKTESRTGAVISAASSNAPSAKDAKGNKSKRKESQPSRLREAESAARTTKVESKGATATAVAPAEVISRTASPAPPKKTYEHLLLPSLRQTLKVPEDPSLFQQLARLFYPSKEPDLKHLNLVKDPPKIKNALAIGVHGYFPAPLIQSVLGRPTGTSIKFADMAAKAIRRYTKARDYQCQVKTAALEGEGKIAERIDLLWKLLLNWIEEIRKADFVVIACHSQGVPVAVMLVAKLIHFGCITSAARVSICAMAGVSMGPFPEYKSRWISGSASELFEFSDPASKVSVDYFAALDDALRFGVRLTYVGSIDDQLVSLESSMFAPISHPHIFRAVSIDSRIHAPSFVSHLVAFVLKLRNLGVQDHGLVKELSAPLAGSLYGGEGHSRLYEDDAIYDLAVAFALETTSMPGVPLVKRDIASSGSNPYILPFAMRGILEEDFVKSDLQDEANLLLERFDEWKPTTKALKDVKFRLEGIRSRL